MKEARQKIKIKARYMIWFQLCKILENAICDDGEQIK